MTSDQAKTFVILAGSALAVYGAVKVFDKMQKTGVSARDALYGLAHDADIAMGNIADSMRGFGIALTNERLYRGEQGAGPYRLTPDEFDQSTINFINSWSAASKIPVDFSKWQVFSDGTIINPYGNYLQMDYASPALETSDGFAVKEIWTMPRYSAGIITPYQGK